MLEKTPLIDFDIDDKKLLKAVINTKNIELVDKVYEYSHAIGYSIAAVVALGLAFLVIKSFLKKKASEN